MKQAFPRKARPPKVAGGEIHSRTPPKPSSQYYIPSGKPPKEGSLYPPRPWSEMKMGPPGRAKQRASDLLEDPAPQPQPEVAPPTTDAPARTEEKTTQETPIGNIDQVLAKIASGAGSIQIKEEADDDTPYSGFKNKILGLFRTLLTQSVGYSLVSELVEGRTVLESIDGPYTISIIPQRRILEAVVPDDQLSNANQFLLDRLPGSGASNVNIYIDPLVEDEDIIVRNRNGKKISTPLFIAFGHEFIHARHAVNGAMTTAETHKPRISNLEAYGLLEEEETIEIGKMIFPEEDRITENDLRAEHGIELRDKHRGGRINYP